MLNKEISILTLDGLGCFFYDCLCKTIAKKQAVMLKRLKLEGIYQKITSGFFSIIQSYYNKNTSDSQSKKEGLAYSYKC